MPVFSGDADDSSEPFRYFSLLDSSSSSEEDELWSSSSSEYTSTSNSTNPGPGSLTGKGILAFGKMVLRVLDGVTIRRRLPELKLLFPHADSDEGIDFEKLYADVLELSRCDLYSDDIRKQALKHILIQIANRNTAHLIQSIIRWPSYEIYLLLIDLLLSMPPSWLTLARLRRTRTKMHIRLCRAYELHFRSIGQVDGALSLTIFMCNLAKTSIHAQHAVLEVGFLDVLLGIYFLELEFTSSFPDQQVLNTSGHLITWNHYLEVFTATPGTSHIFLGHAVHRFWPKLQWDSQHLLERQMAWRSLQNFPSAVQLRRAGIDSAVRRHVVDTTSASLDVCADLFELLSWEAIDRSTSEELLQEFVLWIESYPWQVATLLTIFLDSKCDGALVTLSRLFGIVLAEGTSTPALHESSTSAIDAVVMCATAAVKDNQARKQMILDAGILSLLLAMLPEEINNPEILRTASPMALSQFLETIRKRGLVCLLKAKAEPTARTLRQNILINAFRIFFGSPDAAPAVDTERLFNPLAHFSYAHNKAAQSTSSVGSTVTATSQMTSITVMPPDTDTLSHTLTARPLSTMPEWKSGTAARSGGALFRARKFASRRMGAVLRHRKRESGA